MIKHYSVIIVLLLFPFSSFSQQCINFSYDENGNRTTREVVLCLKMTSDTLSQSDSLDSTGTPLLTLNDSLVKVFPNPTSGIVNVDRIGFDYGDPYQYVLMAMTGKVLERRSSPDKVVYIDLASYPVGIYILKVYNKNYLSVWKLIKQK